MDLFDLLDELIRLRNTALRTSQSAFEPWPKESIASPFFHPITCRMKSSGKNG